MEPSQIPSRPEVCPDCGAVFAREGNFCWLCGWKLGDPVGVRPKRQDAPGEKLSGSPDAPATADPKWTFRLSTLFIWTALVAVVMGVVRIAPGLGIPLGIFAVPAALYTVGVSAYRKRHSGHALTTSEKFASFAKAFATIAGSFAILMLIAIVVTVAAFAAFFINCLASLNKM